jgi:hypothetical protein
MDAVIHQLKLNNVIIELITRDCSKQIKNAVIVELKMNMSSIVNQVIDEFIDELCYIYEGYIRGSYSDICNFVRDLVPIHAVKASPFWLLRMLEFRNFRYDSYCHDPRWTNSKIKYDYFIAFSQIKLDGKCIYPSGDPEEMKTIFREEEKERENIWRGIDQEKLLGLYNKIPIDVFNEILTYI